MSINLNITYQQRPKKITISKASTINQLVSESLTLFKIDSSSNNGRLLHNDKVLDGSLPIRLTNLLNNSKLVLQSEPKSASSKFDINVKFMSDQGSSVKKCSSDLSLLELVKEFNGDVTKPSNMRVLNLSIQSDKYASTSLVSIVGNVNNVVIRFAYENEKQEVEKQQQEAIRLHIEQGKLRKQKEEEQARLQEESERQQQHQNSNETKSEVQDGVDKTEAENQEPKPVLNDGDVHPTVKDDVEAEPHNAYVYKEDDIKETPQLFVPSKAPQQPLYDNPDEDYEMTLHQAKAYQNAIRNSAKRKQKDKVTALPSKYQIRLKFPDATILQINFIEKVDQVKFGNLVRKIDDLLLPEFINIYNLKQGYPPFNTIDMSYANNNEFLHNLPDFQQERIVLIWELQKHDLNVKGPFVKNTAGLSVKQSEDLPERVLERHRGELPDDEHKKKNSSGITNQGNSEKDDGKKDKKSRVPKWLKMK
ncbi:hypothetical protein SBY92_002396 [Candida maltosa Xu316]